ncbi:MAG: hypothetical protein E5V49_13145 [Mesorhizobium sp.]|nr:MAG: hypothetical protein E5V48_11255 [Mesorhizobium sp.]TJW32241.1 MAG: hypothetical protein E5V49_13145 [Mesorhizobium sp.]
MVRLPVEEACDALLPPNPAQCGRDDRCLSSTSTARAHPAQRVRSPAPKGTSDSSSTFWGSSR